MTRSNTLTFLYSYTCGNSNEIGVETENRAIVTPLRDNSDHRHFPQMNCVQTCVPPPNSWHQFPNICHLIHSYLLADWTHFTPQNPQRIMYVINPPLHILPPQKLKLLLRHSSPCFCFTLLEYFLFQFLVYISQV
jgi:hypothetical protein